MWGLIIVCFLALLGKEASGSSHSAASWFIDKESRSIESIAEVLCNENAFHHNKIGRLSTIGQLADHFGSPSFPSELAACRERCLQPLRDLKIVIDTSSENVCSYDKADVINEFHLDYILSGLSRKWRKASDLSIPELLKVFFMQYANEIAERCKGTLEDRLQLATGDNNVKSELLFSTKLGNKADDMTLAMVSERKVNNFDSFILFWNQIIMKERKKGQILIKNIDDVTREDVVGLIKVKDPNNVWSIQQKCRHDIRPIYRDTVLPVMLLFENGYGTANEQSGEIVKGSKLIRNWYALTQLCELLVPIIFYKDESLKAREMAILTSYKETSGLTRPTDLVAMNEIPMIKPLKLDDLLQSTSGHHLEAQVKSNLAARNRLVKQLLKNIASEMKNKLKTKMRGVFITRKTNGNKYVKESGDDILKESEIKLATILDDNADTDESSLERIKRGADEPPLDQPVGPSVGELKPKPSLFDRPSEPVAEAVDKQENKKPKQTLGRKILNFIIYIEFAFIAVIFLSLIVSIIGGIVLLCMG